MISRFADHRRNATLPQRAFVIVALLAYVVSGAIVPQGYMAAPVSSGTPFHLCPGDLRSAQIIDAMPMPGGDHHHHHHHGHHDESGTDTAAADPGCSFAGFGTAVAELSEAAQDTLALPMRHSTRPPAPGTQSPAWLRPPPRSPPA